MAYNIIQIRKSLKDAVDADSIFKIKIKEGYTGKDVDDYTPDDAVTKKGKRSLLRLFQQFEIEPAEQVKEALSDIEESIDAGRVGECFMTFDETESNVPRSLRYYP